ncbi:MAG TPA: Mur ligase family protein [Vitreimonas sp.]|nr:Mur ligase family protein [Vitreimonas sp.]
MNKTTLLAILQQSEYDLPRWKKWAQEHATDTQEVAIEKWTAKLKLINLISSGLFFLPSVTSISLAVSIITPLENMVRWSIYTRASWKLWWYKLRGLKVVAIAGSYAKTSTKNILFHAFSQDNKALTTPNSINTMLGIAQVIREDLKAHHKVFIVEFGEYHPEDIPNLTQFVKPHFGILTPIGRQHLEVIGSFEKLIETFHSFVSYFKKDFSRLIVAEQNQRYFSDLPLSYYGSQPATELRVFNAKVTRAGTEFEVLDKKTNHTYQSFTPLFGEHQAVNCLTAFWLAPRLQQETIAISKRLRTTPYITRRHEPTFAENNVLVLDNSYNTNPDSVQESLKLLNQLEPSRRLLVTLGFTELGEASDAIHFAFGQSLAKQVDYVGLIKAPWTQKIIDGFTLAGGKADHIKVGNSQEEAFAAIQEFVIAGSVVLFEGGYREVYV